METKTRLLENVNFSAGKPDVSAAVANRRPLEGYLGQRALSQSSVEGVTSALASFTRHVGLSLKGVDELNVGGFEVSRGKHRSATPRPFKTTVSEPPRAASPEPRSYPGKPATNVDQNRCRTASEQSQNPT